MNDYYDYIKKVDNVVYLFAFSTPAECRTLLEYQALRPCICYQLESVTGCEFTLNHQVTSKRPLLHHF